MLNRVRYNNDPQIIAFSDGQEAPISTSVSNTYIGTDADGRKTVPAGMFLAVRTGTTQSCFLPRATVTQASTTGTTTLKFVPLAPFVTGDVLYAVEPYAAISVTAAPSVGQTVIITVNGRSLTVTAATTVVADLINAIVAAVPNSVIGPYVNAVGDTVAGKVYLYSRTKVEYSLALAGTATASIDGSVTKLTTQTTALGTIASINPTTGVVTLTGNAGWVAPVGAHVGVSVQDILGLNVHSHDYSTVPLKHVNGITGAIGVYKNALPYIDDELIEKFKKIVFRVTF